MARPHKPAAVVLGGGMWGVVLAQQLAAKARVHLWEFVPSLADALPPDAAAVVNGEPVPMAELQETLLKRHGRSVLQELVLRKLIDQEALKTGVTVSEAEVQRRYAEALEELKKQFAAEVSLAGMLQAQGVSEA